MVQTPNIGKLFQGPGRAGVDRFSAIGHVKTQDGGAYADSVVEIDPDRVGTLSRTLDGLLATPIDPKYEPAALRQRHQEQANNFITTLYSELKGIHTAKVLGHMKTIMTRYLLAAPNMQPLDANNFTGQFPGAATAITRLLAGWKTSGSHTAETITSDPAQFTISHNSRDNATKTTVDLHNPELILELMNKIFDKGGLTGLNDYDKVTLQKLCDRLYPVAAA